MFRVKGLELGRQVFFWKVARPGGPDPEKQGTTVGLLFFKGEGI